MSDKEKLKNNYELLINNLEKKLNKLSNDRKLFNKLKKILGVISILVLIFGLWPITLISILLASLSAYKEKDKYIKYCDLIDRLEDKNYQLSELKDEIDIEKNKGFGEPEPVKNMDLLDVPVLNTKGDIYDYEVRRKR